VKRTSATSRGSTQWGRSLVAGRGVKGHVAVSIAVSRVATLVSSAPVKPAPVWPM
jgi:hypothetical protein